MRTIELFFFRHRSETTGKWVKSRHRATREEIERRYPGAEIVEASREVREVADDWTSQTYRAG